MKIVGKSILGLFGLLLVSTIAMAVFLPLYFDPNDYKEQIAKKVKEETGRDLTLKGDISLSVFPWLGMEMGEATLSNAPGFGQEPFAAIQSAEVRVRLLPLLRKEIEIGEVVLDGVALRLQKNAVGQNNWDDMAEHKKPEDDQDQDEPGEFKLETIDVAALEITNSTVLWDNVQTNSRYQLNDFNFATGRLRSGEPFSLNSDFTLVSGKPAVARKVELEGEVVADLEKKTYHLEDFLLQLGPAGKTTAGGAQPLTLAGVLDVNLNAQTMKISDLVLETAGLKITGAAQGSQILDKPLFKGQIKANDINPRAVMKAMGKEEPNTTDSGVLDSASFESGFEANSERANLQPIRIKLDDSNMNGSLSVANYGQPAIGFNLGIDEIDFDRYLSPPDKKEGGTTGAGAGDGKQEEGEISVDAIKDLNLSGSLRIAKLKIKNLRMDNAVLSLRAKDGVMVIEPFTANFYQGRINLVGRVDARGARPLYGLNAQTSGIKIEPMLTALNGSSKISGTGNLNLNLNASGGTSDALKRNANGNVDFNLRDGEFKGVNVGEKLRQGYAMYKGQPFTSKEPQTTRFSQIQGSAQIQNGVLQNNDLDAQSAVFGVGGAGTANFVAETINYLARITISETGGGELGKGLDELLGKTIPVRLTGNLYDPDWKIDLAGAVQERLKEELKKKTDEVKEEAKQKLQDKLMEKLGGGRKAAEPAAPAAAPSTAPSSAAPAAQPSEATPKSEAELKAEKKAAKKAEKERMLRELLGAPKEEAAPAAAPEAAPAAEPAPAPAQ
jgi:AsmA protein